MTKITRRAAIATMAASTAAVASGQTMAVSREPAGSPKPTVVLVHGAFAESASWNGVVRILLAQGYPVIAASNPLRSPSSDAASVAGVVDSVKGPVVLAGHSYAGSVISAAAYGKQNVKALVFVAAFAPEEGETAIGLTGQFPGSSLGPTLAPPVPLPGGGQDLYILQDKFPSQFAADVPPSEARLMAIAQRPITDAALHEPSTAPAWKQVPSCFVYGDHDKNIPPAAQAFMAKRARAIKTVVVKGASHVVMVSHPDIVAKLISDAASRPA